MAVARWQIYEMSEIETRATRRSSALNIGTRLGNVECHLKYKNFSQIDLEKKPEIVDG